MKTTTPRYFGFFAPDRSFFAFFADFSLESSFFSFFADFSLESRFFSFFIVHGKTIDCGPDI